MHITTCLPALILTRKTTPRRASDCKKNPCPYKVSSLVRRRPKGTENVRAECVAAAGQKPREIYLYNHTVTIHKKKTQCTAGRKRYDIYNAVWLGCCGGCVEVPCNLYIRGWLTSNKAHTRILMLRTQASPYVIDGICFVRVCLCYFVHFHIACVPTHISFTFHVPLPTERECLMIQYKQY